MEFSFMYNEAGCGGKVKQDETSSPTESTPILRSRALFRSLKAIDLLRQD